MNSNRWCIYSISMEAETGGGGFERVLPTGLPLLLQFWAADSIYTFLKVHWLRTPIFSSCTFIAFVFAHLLSTARALVTSRLRHARRLRQYLFVYCSRFKLLAIIYTHEILLSLKHLKSNYLMLIKLTWTIDSIVPWAILSMLGHCRVVVLSVKKFCNCIFSLLWAPKKLCNKT